MDDFSLEGANYGAASFDGQLLAFTSVLNQRRLFDLKLDNVASCVIPQNNRDEVEMQFNESDAPFNREEDSVIQITFRFPSKVIKVDEDEDEAGEGQGDAEDVDKESPAEVFQKRVINIGVVSSVTGNIIVEFSREQGNFVTPRGKYSLQMTASYFHMQGAQYTYKIAYSDINSLFFLPKPDGGRTAFVIALEKPIRQGNQKYQYLVLESHKVPQSITVNLTEEEIKRDYDGQLTKEMHMPLCNLIAKVFKVLSQKSVFVPKHFVTSRNTHAVRCSLKANEGLLYPLAKSFLFINKPVVHIKFEDVQSIEFKRYDRNSNAATRNFDLVITMKPSAVSANEPKEYNFSSIDRVDYSVLFDYFTSKEIPIINPQEASADVYNEQEEDDEEGDDEDFRDDGSQDSEEADDDYVEGASDSEGEGGGGGGGDDDDDEEDEDDEDDEDDGAKKTKKTTAKGKGKPAAGAKKKAESKKGEGSGNKKQKTGKIAKKSAAGDD